MLRTVDSIKGYSLRATDDELGKVKEVYFDDERWGVRYLIVETGPWLAKRRVLISPYSITAVDEGNESVRVSLTRDQVKNSPDIDTDQPVSRQMEQEYSRYYGYGTYWSGPYLWGVGGYPTYPMPDAGTVPPAGDPAGRTSEAVLARNAEAGDTHLRSSEAVSGYNIHGTDDAIGHVEDFIFDDQDWAIRYVLVDTRNWWPGGKKVLLATQWIENIAWDDSNVQTRLTREQIKESPEYDPSLPLERDYEMRLHEYYGRHGYWDV